MRSIGLLDLQVNGYGGVDFNDAALTADALDHALRAMLDAGVTSCLPTLITAPEEVLGQRFAALDAAVAASRLGPFMVPGYHLEGPFLNPTPGYAGCHPPAAMVLPSVDLIRRVAGQLRRPVLLMTLAPEREGALEVANWARSQGVLLAMGHTAADQATVTRATAAGFRLSTHLGNAVPHSLPKFLNPLMAQLAADDLTASVIADGIHVPSHVLKVLLRAKDLSRVVLVTDATSAAAATPGIYHFAGMTIEHAVDGSVRVPGSQVLAGSALRLDQAVRNLVAWGAASPGTAIDLASKQPLALLQEGFARHAIALPDSEVDWSDDLRVARVTVAGLFHTVL